MCASIHGFSVGAGDPNLDPHACMANTFPAEPSSQLFKGLKSQLTQYCQRVFVKSLNPAFFFFFNIIFCHTYIQPSPGKEHVGGPHPQVWVIGLCRELLPLLQ